MNANFFEQFFYFCKNHVYNSYSFFNNMKILHITTHFFPFIGGLENIVLQLAQNQTKKNEVFVLTLQYDKNLSKTETKNKIKIFRHPAFEILKNRYTWPRCKFSKNISCIDPEIVFTHTRFFVTSFLAGRWAIKNKKKWIHVEHGANRVQTKNFLLKIFAEFLDFLFGRWVLKNADQIVVLSEKGKNFVRKLGANPQKIKIIPNGVKINKTLKPLPKKNKALFFGRMIREKGILEILQAAQKCPDWDFELIGEGPLFQKKILPNVIWTPVMSHDQIKKKINESDLILNPSHSEGFSLTIIESAACGRPILATDCGVAKKIISPKFLIKNSFELIKKIKWLKNNYDILEAEGKKNWNIVKEKFSLEKMEKEYEKLLEKFACSDR